MASGKFDGVMAIAAFFNKNGLSQKMRIKRLVLPWVARRIKHEKRKDDLGDWEVIVGPKSANQLAAFLVESASEWGLKVSG